MVDFYEKGDNSTALPGKSDAKSIKCNMPKLQKRVLKDYLSNLYSKYVAENPKPQPLIFSVCQNATFQGCK